MSQWDFKSIAAVILLSAISLALILTVVTPLVLGETISDARSANLSMVLGGLLTLLGRLLDLK